MKNLKYCAPVIGIFYMLEDGNVNSPAWILQTVFMIVIAFTLDVAVINYFTNQPLKP